MVEVSVLLDPTSGGPATGANPFPVKAASTDTALAQILAATPGFGVAGTPSDHVVSVQGHAGGTAVPISAASLPLPSGAATETTLAAVKTGLDTVHADLGTANTTLSAVNAKLAGTLTVSGAVNAAQSGAWLTGVKGLDGSAIASAANPMPAILDGVADSVVYADSVTSPTVGRAVATAGYAAASFQLTLPGVGCTVLVEGSNDSTNGVNGNWVVLPTADPLSSAVGGSSLTGSNVRPIWGVVPAWIRWRVSTYGSGTVTVAMVLRRIANNPAVLVANGLLNVGGNVASGATDSGSPVKIGGVFNTTLPSLSAGQRGDLQIDSKGNLRALIVGSSTSTLAGNLAQLNFPIENGTPGTMAPLAVASQVYNGATIDTQVSASAASGTTGTGVPAAGAMGQWLSAKVNLTTGQFAPAQMTPRGSLRMALAEEANSDNIAKVTNGASDGAAVGDYGLNAQARNFTFNGATWDRVYSLGATGTSATGVQAVGPVGQFNATLPTLTTGQYGGLQTDAKGNLRTLLSAAIGNGADAQPNGSGVAFVTGSGSQTSAVPLATVGGLFNGATWDRVRSAIAGLNSTGTGVAAVGLAAQLDDTTPTAITEDQFGNLRMSSDRGLLGAAIVDTTLATLTAGSTFALKGHVKGAQYVSLLDSSGNGMALTNLAIDAQGVGGNGLVVAGRNTVWNGASWDRQRGDTTGTWSTLRDAAGNARGANVTAANALVVDGSAMTQPVSATSLPLPSGAATAAKQPALGTAGAPSADVLTVQGKAGMTALVVDGSAVTQPVSAASLPLPSGAATSALQTTISGKLDTLHADGVPVSGVGAMTPDVATTAGRGVQIICTVAGNVSLTFTDTSIQVIPVAVGLTRLPDAVTTLNSSGTTATVTCQILK